MNAGALLSGQATVLPCTPAGCIELLKRSGVEMKGANAVVIGRSNIVGKPMALLLLQENCTVTVCHSKTKNLAEITRNADILVAAIGRAKFVKADMIKPGAAVIDVGINRLEDGTLAGDVDFDEAEKVAGWITPVPGGVGPMTIAMLMENTVKAAEACVK
jgi:methylenetetrahydrofolate dehydrogenase (NADP+)/methenyltetrahydrofolate cyclohydrolase